MIEKTMIGIVAAFVLAQGWKMIDTRRKIGKWDWSMWLQNGGMPSGHTATTTALTTGILLDTGISYLFLISAVFTLIVINDAMKVRREAGEEAAIINEMMDKEKIIRHRLSTHVGHTPEQVTIGFILGVVVTLIIHLF